VLAFSLEKRNQTSSCGSITKLTVHICYVRKVQFWVLRVRILKNFHADPISLFLKKIKKLFIRRFYLKGVGGGVGQCLTPIILNIFDVPVAVTCFRMRIQWTVRSMSNPLPTIHSGTKIHVIGFELDPKHNSIKNKSAEKKHLILGQVIIIGKHVGHTAYDVV